MTNLRKQPNQQRAKKRIQQILDVTLSQLASHGIEAITTNHIAQAAGISVGSLYRYFPNKQAVIYSLYQRWLTSILAAIDDFADNALHSLSQQEFISQLWLAVEPLVSDDPGIVQLSRAIGLFPDICSIEAEHEKQIAQRYVKYFKHFGDPAPKSELQLKAMLMYDVYNSYIMRSHHLKPVQRKKMRQWAAVMCEQLTLGS